MSRYVDLDGLSWDGKPIASKIQEVKTKHGYMQGITVGWLWGDNVPHIDLEEHDAKVRQDAIDEELQSFAQWLWDSHYLVDEAFTIRLVEQYKDEQLKEKK